MGAPRKRKPTTYNKLSILVFSFCQGRASTPSGGWLVQPCTATRMVFRRIQTRDVDSFLADTVRRHTRRGQQFWVEAIFHGRKNFKVFGKLHKGRRSNCCFHYVSRKIKHRRSAKHNRNTHTRVSDTLRDLLKLKSERFLRFYQLRAVTASDDTNDYGRLHLAIVL